MEKQIKVYSTPSCPYCVMSKNYFASKGVQYEDIDVTKDEQAAREMVFKSGQMGVPVIDIAGKIVVGYQPRVFDQLLER